MGDCEQPAAQVGGVAQGRISPQRSDESLLEAVVGIGGPHDADEETVDVGLVLVKEGLEWWQDHTQLTGNPRKA